MANTDFSVLLKAELDRTGIDTDLKKVQEIVKKYHLELTPDLQTASLKNQFKSVCKEMANDFNKAFNANVSGNDVFKVYENKARQLQQAIERANKIQLSTDVTKLTTNYQKFGVVSQEVENNLRELKLAQEAVVNAKGTDRLASEIEKYDNALAKAKSSWKELSATQVSLSQRTSQMTTMQEWMRKNGAAVKLCGDRVKELIAECQTCNKVRFDGIKNEFKQIQVEAGKAGKLGSGFLEGLVAQGKKFVQWIGVTGTVMRGIQISRGMIQNVKDLDDSLLELVKVSDLSAEGLEKVTSQAYELGEKVGKTGTQVIDAITTFKRAGFELEQSTNLAEVALKMTNVAEGITDATDSAQYLISIMKGYRNTSDKFAQKILDSVNQVSNTQAIDFDNLVDGAQNLAAVANQAQVSFDEMLGILTGGYEVLGDMSKVSNGMITIFSRLQAIQLEGEEEVETTANLQKEFYNATKGAVNIIDQETGQLRSAYDILTDIADVWDELDSNTQSALATSAAGIRQKNTFLSVIENWDSVKSSVESSIDSLGSAEEENAKYLESISGKISQFDSAVEKLSSDVVNSDLIKFFVDLGTTGVKAIDSIVNALTPLGTAGLIGSGILGAKNIGRPKMFGLIV